MIFGLAATQYIKTVITYPAKLRTNLEYDNTLIVFSSYKFT